MNLIQLQSKLDRFKGIEEELNSRIEENEGNLYCLKKQKENITKAKQLLEYLSQLNTNKVIDLFEHTITCALNDLFNSTYKFSFDIKTRGNSSACDFMVKCSELNKFTNIIMSRGKSIKEIISVIMRIVLIKLDKRSRNIVILDEPMSGVEIDRQRSVSKFLKEISDRFGLQIIMVTHIDEFATYADKEITIRGGK